ncbi:MAG: DUF1993 family protein [Betaproteobacteria bacterium]
MVAERGFIRLDSAAGRRDRLRAPRPGNKTYRSILFSVLRLPGFYFHPVRVYEILGHNGVEIGKHNCLVSFRSIPRRPGHQS